MSKELLFTIGKYLLAVIMIVFGLNKFLHFADVPPPESVEAGVFMGAMFSTYLWKMVAVTEIVGGALLFVPRYAFLGLLLLTPVVANIVGFHVFHDFPGNPVWIVTLVAFVLAAMGYQGRLKDLVK